MEFKEEWVPQLITQFGWLLQIKSAQELESGSICMCSGINWWKFCKDGRASKCVPLLWFCLLSPKIKIWD